MIWILKAVSKACWISKTFDLVGVRRNGLDVQFVLERKDATAMKNRVRELREARGWTQVEFGNQLNISRQTVYAIESGLYHPSLPLALAIGKFFGLYVEEIFGDSGGARVRGFARYEKR